MTTTSINNSLQEFLKDRTKLDQETIWRLFDDASQTDKSLTDLVVERDLIAEEQWRDLLAEYTSLAVGDVPYGLGLSTYQFINFNISFRFRVICYEVGNGSVEVVTDDPLNLQMREVLSFLGKSRKVRVNLKICTKSEMARLIGNYRDMLLQSGRVNQDYFNKLSARYGYQGMTEAADAESDQNDEATVVADNSDQDQGAISGEMDVVVQGYSEEQKSWLRLLQEKVQSEESLQNVVSSRDIPRIVAGLVHYAIYRKASDIHIEALQNEIRVRYRIDGVLQKILILDKKLLPALISRIKILALLKIDEHRVPQDGQFRVMFDGRMVDLRISTLPTVYGEKVVIRILDVSGGRLTLEQLGIDGINRDRVEKNIHLSNGMILSTGPTGSGKSTTLFSILGMVSVPGVNVITLEDPVEYHISGVNQCQTNDEAGFTFAKGLRSILRQDPNIIMVGEIRDSETAELAVNASLTGHLVLSTLHTNDAPSAVPRLIDMGVEPFLISSSLAMVMAQRLVRRVCQNCKTEVPISDEVKKLLQSDLTSVPAEHFAKIGIDMNNMKLFKGLGCDQCQNTGYSGRVGIYEVMEMTGELQELAINKASGTELMETAIKQGMITMRKDGFIKALQGLTTLDEVYRVTTK